MSEQDPSADSEPPLTPQQLALVEHALPLVWHCAETIARKHRGHVQARGLHGAGTIALSNAVRRYRPDRHPSFEYYAKSHVCGRMLDAIKQDQMSFGERVAIAMESAAAAYEETHVIDVDLLVAEEAELERGMDLGCEDLLTDVHLAGLFEARRLTPEDALAAREEYGAIVEVFQEILPRLPREELEVLILVHQDEQTLEEASQALGIHVNTAQRRRTRALRRLRETMQARGLCHAPEPSDLRVPSPPWPLKPDD